MRRKNEVTGGKALLVTTGCTCSTPPVTDRKKDADEP